MFRTNFKKRKRSPSNTKAKPTPYNSRSFPCRYTLRIRRPSCQPCHVENFVRASVGQREINVGTANDAATVQEIWILFYYMLALRLFAKRWDAISRNE
jgi:hypothetical protein